MSGLRLPVFVSSWQIECCWDPPAVGDVLEWRLIFEEVVGGPPEQSQIRGFVPRLEVTALPFGAPLDAALGPFPLRLDAPDVSLYWLAARPVKGPARLAGQIHEDHHGEIPEDFPVTHAIVRRIVVEERHFVEIRPRSWEPIDGPAEYRTVDVSPKWFRHLAPTGEGKVSETGILVDVEVTRSP